MLAAAVCSVPATSNAQAPQTPVGHGTIALEGTMKTFYKGVNVIVVSTMDGVEHTYHFAKDLVVHGGGKGPEGLQGLKEGTTVVLHYSGTGADALAQEIDVVGDNQGLKITEGRVMHIDRGRKEITIQFPNGKSDTFRLTDRAAAEGKGDEAGGKVIIYYADEGGQRVAHYFRAAS
jgi:hypothetical protein